MNAAGDAAPPERRPSTSAARFVVGIDLGTTHTVVAAAETLGEGASQVVPIPQLVTAATSSPLPLLPSVLYAPLPGEQVTDPWSDPPWAQGAYAASRGREVPGRLVASAKSWLCHPRVDRLAAILPWGNADGPRISPRDASTALLEHVRRAWDAAHPGSPLADQDVVLTVPASFDEVARELTVQAAQGAGLEVRLLEEPQAAFYDYRRRAGEEALRELVATEPGRALVLVCDVGGGTTDLSLLRIDRAATGGIEVTRVAVGRHLLLGGDNMDLALAHLCEARLGTGPLDPARYGQLVLVCRSLKETLLGPDAPEEATRVLVDQGSSLVGRTLRVTLSRREVERVVLENFFPLVAADAEASAPRAGLVGFGLPYERDVAITQHVAAFFRRHADGERAPAALLLNGGVFHAPAVVAALGACIEGWGGGKLVVLPNADPDLAVARGAVEYGLSRLRRGPRIASGAARGYYLAVAGGDSSVDSVVCVVPRGTAEGVPQVATGTRLSLMLGRPARFEAFASDNASGHRAGDLFARSDLDLEPLPPLLASFGATATRDVVVPVVLEGELTAIGTLDLACVEVPVGNAVPRRFRLAFQLRPDAPPSVAPESAAAASRTSLAGRPLEEALEAVGRAFARNGGETSVREVKNLVRTLERHLGDRGDWDTATARALFDAVWPFHPTRRQSADHERVFWQLGGFCLRPGVGDPLDPPRVARLVKLLPEKIVYPDEARGEQQFWFAWRRIAAGLEARSQEALRDVLDPFLAPREAGLKKPKGWRPSSRDAMLETASALERVPPGRRSALGAWVLERTWTERDPRLWAVLGRLGGRVPTYATVDCAVPPAVVERWLDHLLRERWNELPTAAEAALRMGRFTGDRGRDVPEPLRRELARRLAKVGASAEDVRSLTEVVALPAEAASSFFGEQLPVGLRLA